METQRERLGQYEILGPLGAGGMGEVYEARDPVLGRKVAIKVLALRLSGDRDTLVRFTQEARSASALNHPNIVTIHEVGMDDGTPYMVMECIEGRDLRTMLAAGPMPNRKTLEIASQIADGLAAAHEQGIIHRDLKPENIMYTKDGFVKILDFGLAKVVRPTPGDQDDTLVLEMPGTNPGTILGTVGYMSPEQATGRPLDFRSDQFALGAILYELATGKGAFDRENAIDTLSAILHEDPDPIGRFNAKIPQPFCWIVDRLLSKDPEERYASTRDLARELRMLRERMATESGGGLEIPRPPRFASKRAPMIAVVAALLLATGSALWLGRDRLHLTSITRAGNSAAKTYLAVMRFQDLTGDRNGQLVVDGFAETLTARLASFPSVQVMRPTKPDVAAHTDLQQIARDLGANVILTGSMQRNGDRLRVSYALYDTSTQTETRRELVEGSFADLFGVQDKLADSVAGALRLGGAAPIARASLPDDATSQLRYLEALGYMRRYDDEASVDNAIRTLESLAGENSASIVAALGRAYLHKYELTHDGQWATRAIEACEKAARMDTKNPDIPYTLGELQRQTGHFPEAITSYKRALAQQPNSADAVLGLAQTYTAAGQVPQAEAEYRHAIELQPNFWGAYNRLGALYLFHGRYRESAEMFQKVIDLIPDSQRGYNNLGAAYQQMGDYDRAIEVFTNSIRKQPTAQGFSNLGTCYYAKGQYGDAAAAYRRSVELLPSKYLYWANLGDAARFVPNGAAEAKRAYTRAADLMRAELRVNPKNAAVHATLAVCLAKLGDRNAAKTESQIALALDPTNTINLYEAAVVANICGETNDAVAHLRKAVALGYNAADLQRDPEFANLRKTDIFQQIPQQSSSRN